MILVKNKKTVDINLINGLILTCKIKNLIISHFELSIIIEKL